MKKNIKLIALCIIIVAVIAATALLPVKAWLVGVLQWTQGLGIWGPVFVAAFYIAACILFLPGSVLSLGTGFIFKFLVGTITFSIGSSLGPLNLTPSSFAAGNLLLCRSPGFRR